MPFKKKSDKLYSVGLYKVGLFDLIIWTTERFVE